MSTLSHSIKHSLSAKSRISQYSPILIQNIKASSKSNQSDKNSMKNSIYFVELYHSTWHAMLAFSFFYLFILLMPKFFVFIVFFFIPNKFSFFNFIIFIFFSFFLFWAFILIFFIRFFSLIFIFIMGSFFSILCVRFFLFFCFNSFCNDDYSPSHFHIWNRIRNFFHLFCIGISYDHIL